RNCAKGRDYASKVVEAWPVQLASWLRTHQPDRPLAPAHLAGCRRTPDIQQRPRILSPAPGQTYLLTGSANESNQKLLLSAATATDDAYWFVDGLLHMAYPSSSPAFWPLKPGTHTITCSDAVGRSSSVVIEVR
ncbi:MAG: hypothetical protein HQ592_04075, partial [Planctomycetes bacterium]|nr:hypothetical protein [Planctomycetota bacterium]